jgi:chaperonin GroES
MQENGRACVKIKPLNDWAVIVPSEAATRTAGGIYIPDAAQERPAEGIVEAVGPGAREEETWEDRKKEKGKKKERKFVSSTVKPGDRVIYERYAGTKIEIGGVERVLVRERSILGIFTGGGVDPKPLMLPERTTAGDTSLATIAMSAITANAPAQPLKSGGRPPAGDRPAKRASGKKPVKKAAKKSAKTAGKKKTAAGPKKLAGKKTASKKTTKKKR